MTHTLTPAEWQTLRAALATVAAIAAKSGGRAISVTLSSAAEDDGSTMDGIETRGALPPTSELDDIENDGDEHQMAHDKELGCIVSWRTY
jgi:hypothetical protein